MIAVALVSSNLVMGLQDSTCNCLSYEKDLFVGFCFAPEVCKAVKLAV